MSLGSHHVPSMSLTCPQVPLCPYHVPAVSPPCPRNATASPQSCISSPHPPPLLPPCPAAVSQPHPYGTATSLSHVPPSGDSGVPMVSLQVELATGQFPYQNCKTDFEVLTKVLQEDPPLLPPAMGFSGDFQAFVRDWWVTSHPSRAGDTFPGCPRGVPRVLTPPSLSHSLTKDHRKRPKYNKLLVSPWGHVPPAVPITRVPREGPRLCPGVHTCHLPGWARADIPGGWSSASLSPSQAPVPIHLYDTHCQVSLSLSLCPYPCLHVAVPIPMHVSTLVSGVRVPVSMSPSPRPRPPACALISLCLCVSPFLCPGAHVRVLMLVFPCP